MGRKVQSRQALQSSPLTFRNSIDMCLNKVRWGGWFRAAHTPAGTSFQVLQQSSWGMESKLSGLFGGSHELWGVAKESRLSEVRGEDLTSSPGSRQPVYSSRNNSNRMCHNMQRAPSLTVCTPGNCARQGSSATEQKRLHTVLILVALNSLFFRFFAFLLSGFSHFFRFLIYFAKPCPPGVCPLQLILVCHPEACF